MWQLARPPQVHTVGKQTFDTPQGPVGRGEDRGGMGGNVVDSPRGMNVAGKERAKGQNTDKRNGPPHSLIATEATGKAALEHVPGI